MIDARELRIGNLVERIHENGTHICYEIVDSIEGKYYGKLPSSDCNPIPLTEEWLIKKFGFEYKDIESFNILCYSRTGFDLNTYKNEEVGYYWLRHYHAPKPHRIKFVHHLQNIYFDFTGEELKPLL